MAVALGGSATLAIMLGALVTTFEGMRNDPYRDLIGTWTVCYGETHVTMRRYTTAQCRDMLGNSLAGYARGVRTADPDLTGPQLVAATSLAYNIGSSAYARSSVARLFRTGQNRAACDAFLRFAYAGGRPVLLQRRQAERKICLTGVS